MAAKYILATGAVIFVALALARIAAGMPIRHPQVRTWLLVALIFAAVSVWL